jgi:hypothetical protein
MAVFKGYESYLGFSAISSTAEVATVPAEFIYFDSASFAKTREREIIQELGVQSRAPRRNQTKNVECTGNFTKSVDPSNGIGLYQYILGGSVTTASLSSGTFTHTFSQGDDVPSGTRLQFEVSFGGNSGSTYRFFGGVVENYSVNASVGNLVKETYGLRFRDHGSALDTVSSVALDQASPITANQASLAIGTSITTTSLVAVKDFTVNITNNLIQNRELNTATVKDFYSDQRRRCN